MKIVFDVKTCLDCPCCAEEVVQGRNLFGVGCMTSVQVCMEAEVEEPEFRLGVELYHRSVEDEYGEVTEVPNWCPHLMKE
jgi:hypothetical protein